MYAAQAAPTRQARAKRSSQKRGQAVAARRARPRPFHPTDSQPKLTTRIIEGSASAVYEASCSDNSPFSGELPGGDLLRFRASYLGVISSATAFSLTSRSSPSARRSLVESLSGLVTV